MVWIAAAVAIAATVAGCADSAQAGGVPTPSPSIGTATDHALPKTILDMPFTTSSGKTVRLSDYAGKTVVISDTMTLCQETCPLDTATVVATARTQDEHTVDKKNTVYLSITIDPDRDTVPQIAAYRRLYSPAPANWHVLTGTSAHINALWSFLGVWRQKTKDNPATAPRNWRTGKKLTYDYSHSDEVFFLDGHGHERFVLEGPPYTARGLVPKKIYRFMDASGHHSLDHPSSTYWTQSQASTVLSWVRTLP